MSTGREQWFADVLTAGLDTRVVVEPDIVAHVTPAVLASSMPRDVIVKLFDAALASGTMSPVAVVETATPALLAAHVSHGLLWTCVAQAAQRAGIVEGSATITDEAREFLRRGLESGLRTQVLTPKDVLHEVNAQVLGHMPDALTAKLIEASLAAGKMTPELVIETLGVAEIARHAPPQVIWACFAKHADVATPATVAIPAPAPRPSAQTASPEGPRTGKIPPARHPSPSKPAIEVMEEDIASVFVDLEDGVPEQPSEPSLMKPLPTAPPDEKKKGLFGRPGRG